MRRLNGQEPNFAFTLWVVMFDSAKKMPVGQLLERAPFTAIR
jgi:hypothetical protein